MMAGVQKKYRVVVRIEGAAVRVLRNPGERGAVAGEYGAMLRDDFRELAGYGCRVHQDTEPGEHRRSSPRPRCDLRRPAARRSGSLAQSEPVRFRCLPAVGGISAA